MERRGNKTYLTAFGETKTLTEWTRDPRCPVKEATTLSSRITAAGMSDQEAVETPLGANVPKAITLTYQGETKTLREWVKDDRCVVKVHSTLLSRAQMGWSDEKVLTYPVKSPSVSKHRLQLTAWGETKTMEKWIADDRCKVDATTLYRRMKRTEFSLEQCMSVPPGRLTQVITAFGDTMTPKQWEMDPRCRVSKHTLKTRIKNGMPPEDAISTPSAYDDQMTVEQRFEAELTARAALAKTSKKFRFSLIEHALLTEAAEGVKGDVQFSNKYLVDKRFNMGIWAEPPTMLAFTAELVAITQTSKRAREATLVRKFLTSLSDRRPQGSGDLYLFADWLCADEDGEVWRG